MRATKLPCASLECCRMITNDYEKPQSERCLTALNQIPRFLKCTSNATTDFQKTRIGDEARTRHRFDGGGVEGLSKSRRGCIKKDYGWPFEINGRSRKRQLL